MERPVVWQAMNEPTVFYVRVVFILRTFAYCSKYEKKLNYSAHDFSPRCQHLNVPQCYVIPALSILFLMEV